jgi:hypothetical protein
VAQEQRRQQRGDVQAVGVGVGEDDHLAVAQAVDVLHARVAADRHRQVVHFGGGEHAGAVDFPGVEDLAAQRQDRLELAVARLLGAAAGGIAFDQEELGAAQVLRNAVGELAGQGGALGDLLATTCFSVFRRASRGRSPAARSACRPRRAGSATAKGVVHRASMKPAAWREDRRSLVWPLNCGSVIFSDSTKLTRSHTSRRELHAARQQVAEIAELAQRDGQARTQPLTCVPPWMVGIRLT